ncbi:MAG: glycosyltransferase family 2 protein, partial [Terriglobia bacterium]
MNEETAQSATPLQCSVIIPTWKRPDLLAATLSSVMNQSYPHLEVVVVSDGEDPGLRELSQEFKNEQQILWTFHATNRGASAARNTGAKQASGEVLLFLDDDVVADRELVAIHMQYHRHFPPQHRLAVISLTAEDRHTKLLSYVDECTHEIYRQMLESFSRTLEATGEKSVGEEVDEILWFGLNSSIRRQSFLSFGGFNEDLGSFDEDMELGLRLHRAGVLFVFEPRLLLTHKNCKSPARYFRNSWKASGRLNAYRVLGQGQKNAQTRRLGSVFHGYFTNRLIARTHW